MGIKERLSGNEAVATAMRQINPDVMPAYPITPSTEIPQYFTSFVANGQVDTEFIPVESEHSAMSACIGSEAAGARTITATSSCGLAPHVGSFKCGSFRPASDLPRPRKPCALRPDQHQL